MPKKQNKKKKVEKMTVQERASWIIVGIAMVLIAPWLAEFGKETLDYFRDYDFEMVAMWYAPILILGAVIIGVLGLSAVTVGIVDPE